MKVNYKAMKRQVNLNAHRKLAKLYSDSMNRSLTQDERAEVDRLNEMVQDYADKSVRGLHLR